MRSRTILIIAAITYAGWTPLYFLTMPERVAPPYGERVERLLPTRISDEAGRIVRGFGFRQRDDEVESSRPFVVYEGSDPLPSDHYALAPFNAKNRWRVVTFRTSDDSDPRYNGRSYYAVLPSAE